MSVFTIGADPEIFVKKNGLHVSAYGLVQGTKKEPQKTTVGAVQVDGMALEINIDPSTLEDFDSFNFKIVRTIEDLRQLVPGYNFDLSPVAEFSEEYLAQQPKEALELGCDPDFNAYTLKENPTPDGTRNFRSAAGHLHIGWGADIPVTNGEHVEICAGLIRMLDATVGMLMTTLDRDPRRRELYGKAGAFRPKSYGVEYRTPSNVWLRNRSRRQLVHFLVNKAVSFHTMAVSPTKIASLPEEGIINVINDGDHNRAITVINKILAPHTSLFRIFSDELSSIK